MPIRDKLYKINNKTISKSINIDDSLYSQITKLSKKVYDATISEIINVAIEEYIDKIQKVTKEDVIHIAENVAIHTIYFLKD